MNLRLLMLAALVAVGCGGGSSSSGSSLEYVYIDPTAPGPGAGSAASPFATWASVTWVPGRAYVQKRGTIAREQITIPIAGSASQPIVIGAYGTGPAPIIQGSEIETGWTPVSGAVYSKSLPGTATGGMVAQDSVPLAFLPWSIDVATTFASATAGSFAVDPAARITYAWCTDGASPDMHVMEVSRRPFGVRAIATAHVTVQDVHVRWASLHGIQFIDSSSCTIANCTVQAVGGAWIGSAYAGNGIEFANSCVNCTIDGCTIQDIFDSGVTTQTFASGQSASGIAFRTTSIVRAGLAGVEIAVLPGWTGSSISSVDCTGVAVIDSGKGWSGDRGGNGDGFRVGADVAAGTLSGVAIDQCSAQSCAGYGLLITEESGTVSVRRLRSSGNVKDGVRAAAAGSPSTLRLFLASSLVHDNGQNGVTFNAPGGQGFELYHTTIHANAGIGFAVFGHAGTAGMKDNIFHGPGAHFYSSPALPAGSINYNAWYENGMAIIGYGGSGYTTVVAFAGATGFEANGIAGDPLVVNAAAGDYRLQSGSACIGAGTALASVPQDFAGGTFASPPSIGAHEYP